MTKRSGTSRTYEERMKKGQPNVTLSLPIETVELLGELAEKLGISRSKVVVRAVQALANKLK